MATFRGRHGYDYFNPTYVYGVGGEGTGPEVGVHVPQVNRAPPRPRPQPKPPMGSTFELKMLPGPSPKVAAPVVSTPPPGSATAAENNVDAQRAAIAAAMMTANPIQSPAEGYGSESPSGVVGGFPLDPNLDQGPQATQPGSKGPITEQTVKDIETQQQQQTPVTAQPVTAQPPTLDPNTTYSAKDPFDPNIDIATVPAKGQPVEVVDENQFSVVDALAAKGQPTTEVVDENQFSVVDALATPIVDENQFSVVDALAAPAPAAPSSSTSLDAALAAANAAPSSAPTSAAPSSAPTSSTHGSANAAEYGMTAPAPSIAPVDPIGPPAPAAPVGNQTQATAQQSVPATPLDLSISAPQGPTVPTSFLGEVLSNVIGVPSTQPVSQTISDVVAPAQQAISNAVNNALSTALDVANNTGLVGWAEQAAPNAQAVSAQDMQAAMDAMSAAAGQSFGVGFGGTSDIGFGAQADQAVSDAMSASYGTDPGTGMATGTGYGYGGGDIGAGFGPGTADSNSYGGGPGFGGGQADADAAAAAAAAPGDTGPSGPDGDAGAPF